MRRLLIGYDIGSSSIKTSLLDADSGQVVCSSSYPENEMPIASPQAGWAEQDPELWWKYIIHTTKKVVAEGEIKNGEIRGIGIAYQMHGLVLVDKEQNVLRPSIIWCDSRAVETGRKAFEYFGSSYCQQRFLNSPGNFTASKLKWVKDNEPEVYEQIHKIMLPGDFIAMKLTGEILISETGLSEGIFWDFQHDGISLDLLSYYGIEKDKLPDVVPSFSHQGKVRQEIAEMLGLEAGIPITYRSGDQPNNAFSLNVLKEGELATTAGTSGTVFGITSKPAYDEKFRVNTFIHVNHKWNDPKYGILLCVNGTGIMNSWLKKLIGSNGLDYPEMNQLAAEAEIGSGGLSIIPFGNGVERIMELNEVQAHIAGLNLIKHDKRHLMRAAQEGIVSSLTYGFNIMKSMGLTLNTVKAGNANMFLSPLFREIFVNMNDVELELYNTDGAQGAARGAGVGSGLYTSPNEAFVGLHKISAFQPDKDLQEQYKEVFSRWESNLSKHL